MLFCWNSASKLIMLTLKSVCLLESSIEIIYILFQSMLSFKCTNLFLTLARKQTSFPFNLASGRVQTFCFTFFSFFITYCRFIARRWFWCHWINDEGINNWWIQRCTLYGNRSAWVGIHAAQNKITTRHYLARKWQK